MENKKLELLRAEKSEMYNALKNKKGTKDYEWWFLRYVPDEIKKRKGEKLKEKERRKIKQKRNP